MAAESSPPLFCPFCEECFEGEARCPEHELPLVPFEALAAARGRVGPADDEGVPMHVMRHGRLPLVLGALTILAGFFLPFVQTALPDGSTSQGSGLATASQVALNLWIVPAVGATVLSILGRRRTPMQMRGSRLALLLLAVVGASSLAYTVSRVYRGVSRAHDAFGQEVGVHFLPGLYVMAAGLLVVALASPFFGRVAEAKPRYRVQ